jgi:hypothetical protein
MTKYWVSGCVKTRLGKTIGMDTAAELHKLFVSHLCGSLSEAGDQRCVCLSPHDTIQIFRQELEKWQLSQKWTVIPQGNGDLGTRMSDWFRKTLSRDGRQNAILIGGDCPLLLKSDIDAAADCLLQSDVVLGPAADGGYYLIGMSGPWQPNFENMFQEVPWSTTDVLEITRQKLAGSNLTFTELQTREDVDTVRELVNLRTSRLATEQQKGTVHQDFFLKLETILKESSRFEVGSECPGP